jgi:ankyrin repeat protein
LSGRPHDAVEAEPWWFYNHSMDFKIAPSGGRLPEGLGAAAFAGAVCGGIALLPVAAEEAIRTAATGGAGLLPWTARAAPAALAFFVFAGALSAAKPGLSTSRWWLPAIAGAAVFVRVLALAVWGLAYGGPVLAGFVAVGAGLSGLLDVPGWVAAGLVLRKTVGLPAARRQGATLAPLAVVVAAGIALFPSFRSAFDQDAADDAFYRAARDRDWPGMILVLPVPPNPDRHRDDDGVNLLGEAIHSYRPWLVRLVVGLGADANGFVKGTTLAIEYAGWSFDEDVVAALVAGGADPNFLQPDSQLAMHAARRGAAEATRSLREAGAKYPAPEFARDVTEAIKHADHKRLRALVAADTTGELRGSTGRWALKVAREIGDDIAEGILLRAEAGAEKPEPEKPSKGNLARMVQGGDLESVREALDLGADANMPDGGGRLPLVVAAALGQPEIARALLAAGAVVDARDKWGQTPLFHAAAAGSLATVAVLLEAGADPNIRTNLGGVTPLFMAARQGHAAVVRTLADAGADVNARNDHDETALSAARKARGTRDAIRVLQELGAVE